jgi:hypothetical protein
MRLSPLLILLAIVPLALETSSGISASQSPAPEPPARYRVTAGVDEATTTIRGQARIEWHNPTASPVSEIRLLTPWNVRHDAAVSLEVTGLKATTSDGTVWSVPLNPPIRGGQRFEFDLTWTARIPELGEGFGTRRGVFLATGWIPRIGLLADDGWHADPTDDVASRTAAFGRFDVDLRVPGTWVIGATGPETARQDHGDGSVTHRFEAINVTDFAWAASASFVERTLSVEQRTAQAIDVRLLLQPEHAVQSERHRNAVMVAIEAYNKWFGSYPWPTLTIVDLPEPAAASERTRSGLIGTAPGLIAVNTPWITPWATALPDAAIMTGVGDQFWRHSTGVDASDAPALASGVTSYVTTRMMRELFGGRYAPAHRYFRGVVTWPFIDAGVTSLAISAPIDGPRRKAPQDSRELTLVAFERAFGWDVARNTLATYLARGRFRHPTIAEFLAVASSEASRDVSWVFNAWRRPSERFDYAVASVATVVVDNGVVESTINLARRADGTFPVHVLVTFADNSSVVEEWDGVEPSHTLRYRRAAPVTTVAIDPDRRLALDANRANNSWSSHPAGRLAAVKWAGRWAAWFQHVLLTYAFFV